MKTELHYIQVNFQLEHVLSHLGWQPLPKITKMAVKMADNMIAELKK